VPFVHLPPSEEKAFFEIAATLIPLLLFGGIIADRLRPPSEEDWRSWHSAVAFYIPLFGACAILAEVTAIQVVVTGDSGGLQRIFVSLVLVVGMLSTIAVIWLPWMLRMREAEGTVFHRIAAAVGAVIAVLGIGVVIVLSGTADTAAQTEETAALQQALERNYSEQDALQQRVSGRVFEIENLHREVEAAIEQRDLTAAQSIMLQVKTQSELVDLEQKRLDQLALEGTNLVREAEGLDPLTKLPRSTDRSSVR
jgi:hypothetical protein